MNRPSSPAPRTKTLCRIPVLATLAALAFSGALAGRSALAADARPADPTGGQRFGTVTHLYGDVTATAGNSGGERKLKVGDALYVGDRVRSAPAAEAVVKTGDAGRIAVRPNVEFVAERFSAEGKSSDSMTVRIIAGSLRFITGWIASIGRPNHKVVTPTATIGVRGTDHEPYVMTGPLAAETGHKPGTYDKVNRGGTTMVVGDNKLDIANGQVGFVRDAAAADESRAKTRLLMTILMPVLLEKVPEFYVPGRFDAELDQFADGAAAEIQRELAAKRKESGADGAQRRCDAARIARGWLAQLDAAAAKGNAAGIIARFAPDVAVRATVRNQDGTTQTVDISRDELAQSTKAAMKTLTGYKHRRVSIEASAVEPAQCDKVRITSTVIESGRQSGKPYRFESVENYLIERRDGKWLAIQAETTQR
jgi:hypothetical protein